MRPTTHYVCYNLIFESQLLKCLVIMGNSTNLLILLSLGSSLFSDVYKPQRGP